MACRRDRRALGDALLVNPRRPNGCQRQWAGRSDTSAGAQGHVRRAPVAQLRRLDVSPCQHVSSFLPLSRCTVC